MSRKSQPDRDQSRYTMEGVRTEHLIEDAHRDHCGARKRTSRGERHCTLKAGWGTSHPGRGYCKLHGGETPAHRQNAARLGAILALEELGEPIPRDPIAALLDCVAEAAINVAFLREEAGKLGVDVIGHKMSAAAGVGVFAASEEARGIVKLYGEWFDRLARVAKMTVDAGVAEAQVRIAERQADQIARVINRVIASMPLTPEQQDDARRVAADEFRTIAIAAPPAEVGKS